MRTQWSVGHEKLQRLSRGKRPHTLARELEITPHRFLAILSGSDPSVVEAASLERKHGLQIADWLAPATCEVSP